MDPLEPFRDRETAQGWRIGALLTCTPAGRLAVQIDLLRFVLAWPAGGASWQPPEAPLPQSESACWAWAWLGCTVQADDPATMQDVCDACACVYEDARRLMRQAIAARLIYPDGTIARCAADLAQRFQAQLLAPGGLNG